MAAESKRKKSKAPQVEPGEGWLVCPSCGAEYEKPQRFCRRCHYYSPDWWAPSQKGKERAKRMRRLLILVLLLIIVSYTGWLCRPYIPNPFVLLNNPSSLISTQTQPESWPSPAYNPAHTRHVPAGSEIQGRVRWTRILGVATDSAPAVVDGTLYVGGHFQVLALSAATGRQIWETETTGPVHSSPAIAGDRIYLGLLDGRVFALDALTGKLVWEFTTRNFVFNSATVVNGILYTGSGDETIYALDALNGRLIWRVGLEGRAQGTPAVVDGILYLPDDGGNLYCLDARTGARRLRFRMYRNLIDSPVVANGLVYFITRDGRLYTIQHGAREYPGQYKVLVMWAQAWLWRLPVPPPPHQAGSKWRTSPRNPHLGFVAPPAVTPAFCYLGDGTGNFYAFDAKTGAKLWRSRVRGKITSSPLVVGDRVYFGTDKGLLYALNRYNGQILWELSFSAPIHVSPVYGAGLIFIRTHDGRLHAVE